MGGGRLLFILAPKQCSVSSVCVYGEILSVFVLEMKEVRVE